MIIRIVKMTFKPENCDDFKRIFSSVKEKIKAFEGCSHVELWQDVNNPNIFFTYSHWYSEEHLNKYRYSDLFQSTWENTKMLFAAKAEAWSVERV